MTTTSTAPRQTVKPQAARRSFVEELRTRGDSEQIDKLERFGRSHLDWYDNYPVVRAYGITG